MGHARKPVNFSLPVDLVAEAQGLTGDLSATVELLLGRFVAAEKKSRDLEREQRLDAALEVLIEHAKQHGYAGEDYLPV